MPRKSTTATRELARILRFEATEEELLAWYLRGVLARTGGNQSEAERVLAIARTTIRRRLAKLERDGRPRRSISRRSARMPREKPSPS